MKTDERKQKLLEALEAEFKKDEGIGEMSLFTKKELNAPMDILRAEIPDFGSDLVSILGEFFFLPFEADEVLYFTSMITLSSTIPAEAAPDVAAAIARLNYYIPNGCYALGDDDRNLVFRDTLPLKGDADIKDQGTAIIISANNAIMTAERYEAHIKLVLKNEITVTEMVKMLKNGK